MNILISTAFFYNNRISKNFLSNIQVGVLSYLEKRTDDHVSLTIANNAFDSPIGNDFHLIFQNSGHSRFNVEIINNEWNKGYGLSHNENLSRHESDIFIILNNDLTFEDHIWLELFCKEIKKGYALVGLKNAPNSLTIEAEGFESKTKSFDYAEGSALAVQTAVAKRHGLFADDIRTAYFEDSDLSLRYRQLGLKVSLLTIAHTHLRGVSTHRFNEATLKTIRDLNKSRFLSRWSLYLERRKFTGKNLIVLDCVGWGDALSSLPAILQLCGQSPEIEFNLELKLGYIQFLFQNIANLKLVKTDFIGQGSAAKDYDRIFRFSDVRCTSTNYLGREIAATMGVDFNAALATRHLEQIAEKIVSTDAIYKELKNQKIAIFHMESLRSGFQGRGVTGSSSRLLMQEAKKSGFYIINIGSESTHLDKLEARDLADLDLAGKASLEQIMGLMKIAKLFVGIDSGPLHIAQYLNLPTFALFGATSPVSKILNWANSASFMDWSLKCLGCYHLLSNSFVLNTCIRLDEACVEKINTLHLKEEFAAFIAGNHKSLMNSLRISQHIQSQIAERELQIGNAKQINALQRALAQYESGTSLIVTLLKRLAKQLPGMGKLYVWLRSRIR